MKTDKTSVNSKITVKGILATGVKNPLKQLLHNETATVAALQAFNALRFKSRLKLAKTAKQIFRFYYSQYRQNAVIL